MQRIQRDPRIKLLTYFVIAAFLAPICALCVPSRAEAQVGEMRAVAVLPLINKAGGKKYGGPDRGKVAADAVALALEQSRQYQVIPTTDVEAQVRQMGLVQPLSEIQMARLGRALSVQGVVHGWINSISVNEKARRATVSIRIEILDPEIQAYMSGASTEVTTPARPGSAAGDDELINEAFRGAADLAVSDMVARQTPEGTVLLVDDLGQATLNLGAQEGMKVNQTLVTLHPHYVPELKTVQLLNVGTMRVTEANPHTSTAVKHTGSPPRTEDRYRVLYESPKVVAKGKRKQVISTMQMAGMGLAAFAGLFIMIGGRSRSSTSADGTAALAQYGNGGTPTIFLKLKNPSIPRPEEILCRVIHRWEDPYFNPDGYSIETVLPYGNNLMWEDSPNASDISIMDQSTPEFSLLFVDSGGDETQATCTVVYTHVPIVPGMRYWYRVQNITVPQLPAGANPPSGTATKMARGRLMGTRQTYPGEGPSITADPQDEGPMIQPPSKPFGGITYLTYPDLVSPTASEYQATDEVEFVWSAVLGADDYRIEIYQGTQTVGTPIAQRTVAYTGQTQFRERITFSPALPESSWFVWRVGCRKKGEPEPNSVSGSAGPTGGPYIYSNVLNFATVPSPPPWPGAATKPATQAKPGKEGASLTRDGSKSKNRMPRLRERVRPR